MTEWNVDEAEKKKWGGVTGPPIMPNKVGDGFRPILALRGGPELTLIWAS